MEKLNIGVTAKDARKALEVIVAAKRSYSEGKPVQI